MGAVGKASDKHGVFDGHADPADFGEDEGNGEVESWAKFGAQSGPGEHEGIGECTGRKQRR